jgi:RNA recognition motif-containing protein
MQETAQRDGRRRNNRNRNNRRDRSEGGSGSGPRAKHQQPTGFFAKLLSFIGLGKKKPARREDRPHREPVTNVTYAGGAQKPREDRGERRERSDREPRQPQAPREVTSERLHVGNLSFDASESDLFELFNGVGSVRNAEIVVNKHNQRSKGFGFITMSSMDEAKRAVAELHNKAFMGRNLTVGGAKPPREDREASSSDES